jgi:hypothetical protein
MQPQYDTEVLIENIKLACAVPTSQLTYTNADFAKIAEKQLATKVVPLIMSAREEYFVESYDTQSPADGRIEIPSTAVGAKLRSVCYLQQENPLILINLPRIDLDVVAGSGFWSVNTLAGFYVEGNEICLYPNTSVPTNTNMRLYFYRRRLTLAPPEAYGRVVAIDSMTNSIQLDFVPYDWAAGTQVNSVSSLPNFKITNPLMTVSNVSSPTIIVDDVTDLSVGDYISEYGYSAIPQVPVEAHNYLAQLSAVQALKGLGDREGAADAEVEAGLLKESLLVMISQRVDGSVKKVMHPNGGLRLGAGLGWRRSWQGS